MGWLSRLIGKNTRTDGSTARSSDADDSGLFPPVTDDAADRKSRSETLLHNERVPVNPHLPAIEGEREARLRSAQDVAERVLALTLVSMKGEGLDQATLVEIVNDRKALDLFTPEERAFIDDPEPSETDKIRFTWRYEAAWVLLWALRQHRVPLGPPRNLCDPAKLVTIVRDTPDISVHGLRAAPDILDKADLIYRYHWAITQARLEGKNPPSQLNPAVALERHHAFNWLIGYNDSCDWDDVSTDT